MFSRDDNFSPTDVLYLLWQAGTQKAEVGVQDQTGQHSETVTPTQKAKHRLRMQLSC